MTTSEGVLLGQQQCTQETTRRRWATALLFKMYESKASSPTQSLSHQHTAPTRAATASARAIQWHQINITFLEAKISKRASALRSSCSQARPPVPLLTRRMEPMHEHACSRTTPFSHLKAGSVISFRVAALQSPQTASTLTAGQMHRRISMIWRRSSSNLWLGLQDKV